MKILLILRANLLVLSAGLLIGAIAAGCSGEEENTVIDPGEGYQPTEQEKENQKYEEEMRRGG